MIWPGAVGFLLAHQSYVMPVTPRERTPLKADTAKAAGDHS